MIIELQEYEYDFIVEDCTQISLANVLAQKVREKMETKPKEENMFFLQKDLRRPHYLYFDGSY